MNGYNLTNLKELEAEAIHIIREVAAEFENPVMLYSIGKDSSVMVRLAEKAAGAAGNPGPGPEAVVVRREEDQEVLDALSRLRPTDRELLRLAVWEELPHAAIGEILGCSAHAVDQRLYRATRRLARELGSAGHRSTETAVPPPSPRGEAP